MRTYEVVFVTAPTVSDEDLSVLVEQMKKSAESKNGKVVKIVAWGKRAMAYPIKKFKEGIYTIFTVEDNGDAVTELERRFRVTDAVIRFLSVRVDEDWKRQQKMKTRREAKKARRGKTGITPDTVAQEIDSAAQME